MNDDGDKSKAKNPPHTHTHTLFVLHSPEEIAKEDLSTSPARRGGSGAGRGGLTRWILVIDLCVMVASGLVVCVRVCVRAR